MKATIEHYSTWSRIVNDAKILQPKSTDETPADETKTIEPAAEEAAEPAPAAEETAAPAEEAAPAVEAEKPAEEKTEEVRKLDQS